MSVKNQKYNKPAQTSVKVLPVVNPEYLIWLKYALLSSILIVTFWCYHYSLHNEFTNWDDQRFISENIFIKSFAPANLRMMLFHDVTGDYYNPLTIISYAINYQFSGLAPESYYFTNIVIHLLNSCLMFFLILMLLKAMEKKGYEIFKWKEWMAFFCTLAFAIHPMHVESVSWIAERKDLLYFFFYFAGLLAYIKYVAKSEELRGKSNKSISFFPFKSYLLVLILYLLSILSKPMAVVFPFSLLAIDVLLKRDTVVSVKKIVLEKLPFIIIFILSAISTFHSEKLSGAAKSDNIFSFFQQVLFATYSFYMYIQKAVIPLPQSSFYPYPALSMPSGYLPAIYYLSLFLSLVIILLPLYLSYQSGNNNFRVILFGLGFYFVNMFMVSKIISSGPYLLADRYTYVCYLGIFFPATYFANKIIEHGEIASKIVVAGICSFLLFLSIVCYQRTYVWHNTETLWTDVINKYPHRIGIAYNNLGNYYRDSGDPGKAYKNYAEADTLEPNNAAVYCDIGLLLSNKKQYDSALAYFTLAIKTDSNFANAYLDRGIVYSKTGKYDFAMNDYRHSSSLQPFSEALLQDIAFTWLNAHQFDSAIVCYNRLIKINPNLYGYYHCRGMAEYFSGNMPPAIADFNRTIQLDSHDSTCMFYLSIAYKQVNDFNNAYRYAQMAKTARYPVPEGYINSLKDRLNVK